MAFMKSLLANAIFAPLLSDEGATLEAIQRVMEDGYYSCLEVGVFQDAEARKRLRETVQSHDARLTHWAIPIIQKEGLDLSSADGGLRLRSIERLKELIALSAECGARFFGVCAGADPGPEERCEGTKRLLDSCMQLCEEMKRYSGLRLLIEPMDREADKKQLIGPIDEAVALTRAVGEAGNELYLAWDSAHEALSGDDLAESLRTSLFSVEQLHLANAVLAKSAPGFGDKHMPVGQAPGFLSMRVARGILHVADQLARGGGWNVKLDPIDDVAANVLLIASQSALAGAGGVMSGMMMASAASGAFVRNARNIFVGVEMNTPAGGDPFETEKRAREFLDQALIWPAPAEEN